MESLGGFAPSPISTPRSQTPVQQGAASDAPPDSPTPIAQGADPASPLAAASKTIGLDKEVQSVVSGFSSFWGRVKKQGTAALQTAEKQYESARADLTPLLSQARANLDHLGEQTRAEIQRLSEAQVQAPGQGVMIGADGMPVILDEVPPPKVDKGKGVDRSGDSGDVELQHDAGADAQQTPAAAASAFFASLASNPNVKDLSRNLSTLQTGVSRNLHQLQAQITHLDLAEGQKVAEGYLHKGEHWFQEFSAEVGKLAKDAVKVVPPGGGVSSSPGASPDGGARASMDKTGAASALSRRELVLYKLRTDTALFLADPAGAEGYDAYLAARGALTEEAREAQVAQELGDGGEALRATHDELVPAQLDEETFWTRYFWRKQAIEDEEERRKKVLQIAEQSEDDFSWDMDEDDAASSAASPRLPSSPPAVAPASLAAAIAPVDSLPDTPKAAAPTALPSALPAALAASSPEPAAAAPSAAEPAPLVPAPASGHTPAVGPGSGSGSGSSERSPRASSDGAGSYDVVHAESGNPSGDEAGAAAPAPAASIAEEKEQERAAKDGSDEEDSDWE
ncbi:hypothetical protein JCM10450v2_001558 [Rhodotorula kratochvilovae]